MKIKVNGEESLLDRNNMNLMDIGLFRKYEEVNPELDYVERTKSCMTIAQNKDKGE